MKIAGQRRRTLDIRASLQIDHFLISYFFLIYQLVKLIFISEGVLETYDVTLRPVPDDVHKSSRSLVGESLEALADNLLILALSATGAT
ncbi:MAG: hypothetical protein ABR522_01135 [Marinobacter sp.]